MKSPRLPGAGLLGRARNNFAYLAAFCMDLALGAGLIALNYLAKDSYRASPGQLGTMALLSAGVYFGSSLVFGRLSDRWGRRPSITTGCLLAAAAFAAGSRASSLGQIYLLAAVTAAAMGFVWPALEADISDNASPRQLPGRIGRFNVAWCTGFAVTGLSAGTLCQLLGHRVVLLAVGGIALATTFVFLGRTFDTADETPGPAEPPECPSLRMPGGAVVFWKVALLLNFAAMGANATLRYHVPTVTGGARSALGGTYLTVLFSAQTITFLFLGRWHGWHYRAWPLAAASGLIAGGGLLCFLGPSSIPVFTAGCALSGVGCGLVYNSSIYYSVASESAKGHRGGIHESVLALGAAVVPYLGGLIAMLPVLAGRAEMRKGMPFLTAAAFMLLAFLAGFGILLRGSSSVPVPVEEAPDRS